MASILQRLTGIPDQEQVEEEKIKTQLESMKDFERVVHILSSCVHEAHIEVADNCFQVFKNKWNNLSKEVMDYNYLIYRKERERLYNHLARLDSLMEERSGELLLT
jgi:CDP-diacylglycerol pyrophosphatase